jgi:nanoRNase/pAp phosphatase (c-di-AMP/oligoRNAs hydrolase)
MDGCKSIYYTLLNKSFFNITSHSIADADGVCAAALLNSLFPQSKIVFLDSPSSTAKEICKKYNIEYSISSTIKPEETVLVDVSDPALLKEIKGKFFAVIDHHTTVVVNVENKFISEESPSTTYLIYEIMKKKGIVPSSVQAELILLGLISDTYRFKSVGSVELFEEVSNLLNYAQNDYKDIVTVLDSKMTFSERITFIRSFGKVYSAYREKKTQNLFVITDTDSFTSLVSTRLVECLGANIGIAYALMEGSVVISMRTSSNMKIHSGKLMKELGEKYKGEGGGHVHAAGCKLNKKYFDDMEKIIVDLLSENFKIEEVDL